MSRTVLLTNCVQYLAVTRCTKFVILQQLRSRDGWSAGRFWLNNSLDHLVTWRFRSPLGEGSDETPGYKAHCFAQMGFFRKLPEPRFPHRGLSIIGHRGCDSQLLIGPNHSRVISAPRLFLLINCRTSRYHRAHFYSRQPGSLYRELFSSLHESPCFE